MFIWHAIGATQVAGVRQGNPQVIVHAMEAIGEHSEGQTMNVRVKFGRIVGMVLGMGFMGEVSFLLKIPLKV
jgi:hypothetical protein